jgi:hypothetical protein
MLTLVVVTRRDYTEGSVYLSDNPEHCRTMATTILANNPNYIRALHRTVKAEPGCKASLDWWKRQGRADGIAGQFCPIVPQWANDAYLKHYNKGRIKALDDQQNANCEGQ